MAKRKSKPLYVRVKVEDIGSEGKSLARIGDMVVFTKMTVPGDIADLQVIKKRKRYQEAVVVKIHEYSADRVEPFCKHFGICGGCKWQMLPYEKQLFYKQKQVADQLCRIGKADIPEINPILASVNSRFYRNKLEFTFSNKRWLHSDETANRDNLEDTNALGFHIPGLYNKVINIEKCWLQPEPSNQIRNFVYRYAINNRLGFFDINEKKGFLRTLIVRTASTGQVMVILSFFSENKELRINLLEALKNNFPQISSLLYVINSKGNDTITDLQIHVYCGQNYILEQMDGLTFKIGPKSFYQTNSEQACNLYKVVREFADFKGDEIVYDLYTGTGTIANFVARFVKKVIGIEYVSEAILDAKENALLNNNCNTYFYSGDIKELLNQEFVKINGYPGIIITDPPRTGMHSDVVQAILKISPEKIIYVSCNPATQARDLLLLNGNYIIKCVQPVDMFPHTHHVENVVLLEKKK